MASAHEGRNYLVMPLTNGYHEAMQRNDRSFPEGEGSGEIVEINPAVADDALVLPTAMNGFFADDDVSTLRKFLNIQALDPREFQPVHEDGSVIDVMVTYTPYALDRVWAAASISEPGDPNPAGARIVLRSLTQAAFDNANLSLMGSEILTWFNMLPDMYELDYDERPQPSGFIPAYQIVADLAGDGDGKIDNVHNLRNADAADIVVMLTGQLFGIGGKEEALRGRAEEIRPRFHEDDTRWVDEAGFERYFSARAFTVIRVGALVHKMLAHEIGHLMGAAHDRYQVEQNDPNLEFCLD